MVVPMPATETRQRVPAQDGQPIDVFTWAGPGPARALVQIAHGMGEHSRRYRALADALTRAGCAVYANDHRGHGEEALRPEAKGNLGPRGFTGLVDDMVTVSDFAQAQHPGLPLILLGHSMGSFAAQLYLLDHAHRLCAAALSGTAALDLLYARRSTAWKLEDNNVVVKTPRTPFDWLSRDEAQVDAYMADPLCGFTLTPESRRSMSAAYLRMTQPAELERMPKSLPLYVLVGEADPINRKLELLNPLIDRYRGAGMSDVSVQVYPGGRHELFNETNRAEVTAGFVAWVERVLPD
jgi:alpha-beta hydrolase superfamily lysophospholipase